MAGYPWEIQSKYPPRGISSNGMDIMENPDTAPVLIGHTLAYCTEIENALNEALAKAEGYFDELVNAGLKTKPKTTEDMLLEAMNAIKYLADKVEKLEGENSGNGSNDRDNKGRFKSSQPKGCTSAGQSAVSSTSD